MESGTRERGPPPPRPQPPAHGGAMMHHRNQSAEVLSFVPSSSSSPQAPPPLLAAASHDQLLAGRKKSRTYAPHILSRPSPPSNNNNAQPPQNSSPYSSSSPTSFSPSSSSSSASSPIPGGRSASLLSSSPPSFTSSSFTSSPASPFKHDTKTKSFTQQQKKRKKKAKAKGIEAVSSLLSNISFSQIGSSSSSSSSKEELRIGAPVNYRNQSVTGMFGVSIDRILRDCNKEEWPLPPFIEQMCLHIETFLLGVEGIFRLSPTMQELKAFRDTVNDGRTFILREDENAAVVAELLKLFLRELPDPILTYKLYYRFIFAAKSTSEEEVFISQLKQIVEELPHSHQCILKRLFRCLARVAEFSHVNKMDVSNLAKVIGPNLLRPPPDDATATKDASRMMGLSSNMSRIAEMFIRFENHIFGGVDYTSRYRFYAKVVSTPTASADSDIEFLKLSEGDLLLVIERVERPLPSSSTDQQPQRTKTEACYRGHCKGMHGLFPVRHCTVLRSKDLSSFAATSPRSGWSFVKKRSTFSAPNHKEKKSGEANNNNERDKREEDEEPKGGAGGAEETKGGEGAEGENDREKSWRAKPSVMRIGKRRTNIVGSSRKVILSQQQHQQQQQTKEEEETQQQQQREEEEQ